MFDKRYDVKERFIYLSQTDWRKEESQNHPFSYVKMDHISEVAIASLRSEKCTNSFYVLHLLRRGKPKQNYRFKEYLRYYKHEVSSRKTSEED